jgi:hypothetical protein
MSRVLLTLTSLAAVTSCYDTTYRGSGDADADADIDEEPASCPEAEECDALGFDVAFEFDLQGEVVTVEADQVVFLGSDGVPATFVTCGPSPLGLLVPGMNARISHLHPDGADGCWLSTVETGDVPALVVSECEGDSAPMLIAPTGMSARFEPACEGTAHRVCTVEDRPVHLAIPEVVHDLELATDAGVTASVALGESVDIGGWLVRLLDARSTEAASAHGCSVPAGGRSAVSISASR